MLVNSIKIVQIVYLVIKIYDHAKENIDCNNFYWITVFMCI